MTKTKTSKAAGDPIRYAAFLRGINVGGHRLIKMDELAKIFVQAGFDNVRTVIASGNVLFTCDQTDAEKLTVRIDQSLREALGYDVQSILRTVEHLRELIERDPFKAVDDPAAKTYVTFLATRPADVPHLPVHVPDEGFSVLAVRNADVFTVSHKLPNGRYGDATKFLGKSLGKILSTTRNWNTVVKMARL